MASRFFPRLRLSMAQQLGRMAALFPGFEVAWRRGLARWTGELRPTDVSPTYRVVIDYRLGIRPIVKILAPALRDRGDGAPIPHRFPDQSLCLYLTNSGEWAPDKYIAETTVPWTSLWLYYYETWLAIGEWLGGGVHPRSRKRLT
jgi:hypothetical protein